MTSVSSRNDRDREDTERESTDCWWSAGSGSVSVPASEETHWLANSRSSELQTHDRRARTFDSPDTRCPVISESAPRWTNTSRISAPASALASSSPISSLQACWYCASTDFIEVWSVVFTGFALTMQDCDCMLQTVVHVSWFYNFIFIFYFSLFCILLRVRVWW